ncbi:MAG: hypothetical protein AB8B55_23615 [Mariniblastus sp.]
MQKNGNDCKPISRFAVLTMVRESMHLATEGKARRSNYVNALNLATELYPKIFGEDCLLRRRIENEELKYFRQKADSKSKKENRRIEPLSLVEEEIKELSDLVSVEGKRDATSKLRRRLSTLEFVADELRPESNSENRLIFRDSEAARPGPRLNSLGGSTRLFEVDSNCLINVRTLHPDQPEVVTGADLIYERHDVRAETGTLVAIQYKIWSNKLLRLSDERLLKQVQKMKRTFCDRGLCASTSKGDHSFRFPYCTAFLRPTDQLQSPDTRIASTGEHIPVCQIDELRSLGKRGGEILSYKNMKDRSLNHAVFQDLFDRRKIGSRTIPYSELKSVYADIKGLEDLDRVILHVQEYRKNTNEDWRYL